MKEEPTTKPVMDVTAPPHASLPVHELPINEAGFLPVSDPISQAPSNDSEASPSSASKNKPEPKTKTKQPRSDRAPILAITLTLFIMAGLCVLAVYIYLQSR